MPLTSGARLGPYEILAAIGAGGMGEVYKARDTRLDRSVAIKVLPAALSSSAEVRQRFEREAKTISQLSHPHICALYDVGREGEAEFLVMELLEGETLSDRLGRGPLPFSQALRYGIEIAGALDAAHRQGIVHRDLKPGNVMLTKSGVKLLDFGLAKVIPAAASRGSLTSLPTQQGLTQEGTILGTFQYMAPEQLEGKEADARTDVFALGVVLYEMTTGRKAFSGTSQASLISAIMQTDPPPVSSLQAASPATFDRLIQTCLAKDSEDRWQTARDVMLQLKGMTDASGAAAAVSAPSGARRLPGAAVAWVVAGLAIAAALWLALRRPPPPVEFAGAMRSSLLFPDYSSIRTPALSPDGTRIVVAARDSSGKNQLFVRRLNSSSLEPLPGTDGSSFPFWSPDGRFIGFFADGKLKKIDASGGPPQTLCDAPVSRGGTWNADGTILFSPVPDGGIHRVSAAGGQAKALTQRDRARGETTHRWPFFLPDGHHFLYLVATFASNAETERMGIYVGSLEKGEEKFLFRANSSVAYAPPGYLLFYREGTVLAQRFDAKSLQLSGDPFPIAEDVHFFPQTFFAPFSVSQNQVLLYQTRTAAGGLSQLVWLDRSGKALGTLGVPAFQANPRISPDGKRVALDVTDSRTGNIDVWLYEAAGTIATRFTTHLAIDACPVWSPNGDRLSFMSFRSGHADLYVKNAGGERSEEPVLLTDSAKYPTDWSRDGRYLLYRALESGSNTELWVVPIGGEGKARAFLRPGFDVTNGLFSPDGRWVAYQSNESGRIEIHVAPFPGPGGSWRISSAGGSQPRWRSDGRELFYIAPDGKLMSVAVKGGPAFEAEPATPLFSIRPREPSYAGDLFNYDVSADGQRFLVNNEIAPTAAPTLDVVVNWAAEKKR